MTKPKSGCGLLWWVLAGLLALLGLAYSAGRNNLPGTLLGWIT